jgi:hypothetical protein
VTKHIEQCRPPLEFASPALFDTAQASLHRFDEQQVG